MIERRGRYVPIVRIFDSTIAFPDEMPPEEIQGVIDRDMQKANQLADFISRPEYYVPSDNPEEGATSAVLASPIVGDITGLAMDAHMYATDPDSHNWFNYLFTAAGILPAIPAASQVRLALKKANLKFDPKDVSFRGGHTAPGRDYGAPMHDMGKMYPDDIYDVKVQKEYYGTREAEFDDESFRAINAAKGSPDAEITVYRAVPENAPDEINAGDWVTPSRSYADMHGAGRAEPGTFTDGENWKILEAKVKAGDLFTEGNSPHEFGWNPSQSFDPGSADISHLSRADALRYESAINNQEWDRAAELAKRPKITAYHGSPHDFDKFQMSQIGTGEGAQAYGHGLYFAENEGVAKMYKESLTPAPYLDVGGMRQHEYTDDVADKVYQKIVDSGAEPSKGLRDEIGRQVRNQTTQLVHYAESGKKGLPQQYLDVKLKANENKDGWLKTILEEMNSRAMPEWVEPKGAMYQVEIDASPDEFLDWDLPLSEQSEGVRRVFETPEVGLKKPTQSGAEAYREIAHNMGSSTSAVGGAPASNILSSEGIKGIRYKDGFSRGDTGGTSNYVVFDENLISIAKKYGIAIPAAAAMAYGQDKSNQGWVEDDTL